MQVSFLARHQDFLAPRQNPNSFQLIIMLSLKSFLFLLFLCGYSLCTTSAFGISTSQQQQQQQQQTLKKSTIQSDASFTVDNDSSAERTTTTTMTLLSASESLLSYLFDSLPEKQQQRKPPFKLDLSSLFWQPHKKQMTGMATTASVEDRNAMSKSSSSTPSLSSFNPLSGLWDVFAVPTTSSSSTTSETYAPAVNDNNFPSASRISTSNSNEVPTPLATQGDWGAYLDDSTGLVYYFNTRNGASQWKPPTPDFPRVQIPRNTQPQPVATLGHWSSYWDQMGTGWMYYFNRQTGQSTWERPFDSFPGHVVQKKTVATAVVTSSTSSSSSSGAPLPLASQGDWAAYADSKGRIYYWNRITQTSQWQPPRNFPAIRRDHDGGKAGRVVAATATTKTETKKSIEPWFGQLLEALVQLVQQASQQQQGQRISEEQQQQEAARSKGLFGLFGHQDATNSKKDPRNKFNWNFGELFSFLKYNKAAKMSERKTISVTERETAFNGYTQPKPSSISKKPMPSLSDLIYQDRKIDSVRYAPTFSIPNPKGRRQQASRRRQQQLTLSEKIPRLAQ